MRMVHRNFKSLNKDFVIEVFNLNTEHTVDVTASGSAILRIFTLFQTKTIGAVKARLENIRGNQMGFFMD